jgi:deoxyribodipyrimidine photo-lyase
MVDPLPFGPADPRVRRLNDRPVATRGDFVLYWMQAFRRADDNAALAFAIERANDLGVPCLVYEALRSDCPHASDRLHRFVLEGARETAIRLADRGVAHVLSLPGTPDEARGAMAKLAARARLVVSDDFPGFVVRAHSAAVAQRAPCAFFVVDDCAVVPMALLAGPEIAARTIRPRVAGALEAWLRPLMEPAPHVRPLEGLDLPFPAVDIAKAGPRELGTLVAACAIDHGVPPVEETPGGTREAERRLAAFVRGPLATYDTDRSDPSRGAGSGLSPYLHFGMVSARRVALEARAWGHGAGLAAFLEQLLVRRALAFHFARCHPDHAEWTALPAWARATLEEHAADRRHAELSLADLEAARSPDELWNATMNELRTRGVVQPCARTLWGKLPLLWMKRPQEAHAAVRLLNDKWALDGRDPSGYANVSWCFGLHDRPWPQRAIFGKVRAMTTGSARRKFDFEGYVERWNRPA